MPRTGTPPRRRPTGTRAGGPPGRPSVPPRRRPSGTRAARRRLRWPSCRSRAAPRRPATAASSSGTGWIDTGGCDTRNRILTPRPDRQGLPGRLPRRVRRRSPTPTPATHPLHPRRRERGRHRPRRRALGRLAEGRPAVARGDAESRSPTTRWTCSPSTRTPTVPRATGTPPPGCPPTSRSAAHYVARQVAVKTKYKLWVTQAEKDAIGRVLATCPGEKLPAPGAPTPVTVTRTPPAPTPTPYHRTTTGTQGSRRGARVRQLHRRARRRCHADSARHPRLHGQPRSRPRP